MTIGKSSRRGSRWVLVITVLMGGALGGACGSVARPSEPDGGEAESPPDAREVTVCIGECECGEGETAPCGTDEGVCVAGLKSCAEGSWGDCVGAVAPAPEICNGLDDDCDGTVDPTDTTYFRDSDGDGYGDAEASVVGCVSPGWVANGTDCADGDPAIHPGAAETCNGQDDNCNQTADEGVMATYWRDADSDGFGNPNQAETRCPADGWVTNNADCYDASAAARPGQTGWFTVNRGDGSFDYDCDELPAARYTTYAVCGSADACSTIAEGWWEWTAIPACGDTRPWTTTCTYDAYENECWGSSYDTVQVTQACR